jgi:hypothetical protein
MKMNERYALFSRFLIEEAWEFDRAKRWMIGNATKRPISTIIFFKAVLPQQPRREIALGQELTAIQTQNGHKSRVARKLSQTRFASLNLMLRRTPMLSLDIPFSDMHRTRHVASTCQVYPLGDFSDACCASSFVRSQRWSK